MVDCGHPLVKATYRLEGDGPLIFQTYEEIAIIRAAIHSGRYPSLLAVTQEIANGDSTLQQHLYTYICHRLPSPRATVLRNKVRE